MTAPKKPRQSALNAPQPGSPESSGHPVPNIDRAMEKRAGISVDDLSAILLLASIRGLGPQVFRATFRAGITPHDLLDDPSTLSMRGKRGDSLREQIRTADRNAETQQGRARRYISAANQHNAKIITYLHPAYPASIMNSNYPIPLMFARGSLAVLNALKTVACVGSREINPPYSDRQREFAGSAASSGFTVVSGFALGADSIAHRATFEGGGSTICVLPGGLDRPFPPENRGLWNELLAYRHAVFVSEAPFGTLASSLTLRKRNKLIVSFALGVMVGQSSNRGGAMNAYRFAIEQHKPVATFEADGTEHTTGNLKISQETKVSATTFTAEKADHGCWMQWLHGLYSSI